MLSDSCEMPADDCRAGIVRSFDQRGKEVKLQAWLFESAHDTSLVRLRSLVNSYQTEQNGSISVTGESRRRRRYIVIERTLRVANATAALDAAHQLAARIQEHLGFSATIQ